MPIPFEIYVSSDIDGSPHVIVDAADADLTGWAAELEHRDGTVTVESFTLDSAWRVADGELSINPYYSGEVRPAWLLCVEGQEVVAYVEPNGVRH